MVKPRQKNLAEVIVKSKVGQNDLRSRLNVEGDSGLSENDSWVIVKKQRVIIWIPPDPATERSAVDDLEQLQPACVTPRDLINSTSDLPCEKSPELLAERNESVPSVPRTRVQPSPKVPLLENNLAIVKPQNSRILKKEDRVVSVRDFPKDEGNYTKFHKRSVACKPLRSPKHTVFCEVGNLYITTTLNNRTRATMLERKIAIAGGLERWLTSLGLEQFVRLFYGQNMNKFQLSNLSMEKLKGMGVHAVGPRRKLIHAIQCASWY